jgi:hypothetical protein
VDTAGGSAFSDKRQFCQMQLFLFSVERTEGQKPPMRPDLRDGNNFERCRAESKCGGVNRLQLAVGRPL